MDSSYPNFTKNFCLAKNGGHFEFSNFWANIATHENAYILKTVLDRADYANFGCHNNIRLEAEHFLNTLALTFISFSGPLSFFFASDSLVCLGMYQYRYLVLLKDKESHHGNGFCLHALFTAL